MLGQFVDINSAIGQDPRFSINPANPGVRRNNSFQSLSHYSSRHNLPILPYFGFRMNDMNLRLNTEIRCLDRLRSLSAPLAYLGLTLRTRIVDPRRSARDTGLGVEPG